MSLSRELKDFAEGAVNTYEKGTDARYKRSATNRLNAETAALTLKAGAPPVAENANKANTAGEAAAAGASPPMAMGDGAPSGMGNTPSDSVRYNSVGARGATDSASPPTFISATGQTVPMPGGNGMGAGYAAGGVVQPQAQPAPARKPLEMDPVARGIKYLLKHFGVAGAQQGQPAPSGVPTMNSPPPAPQPRATGLPV